MRVVKIAGVWALQILVGCLFVMLGVMKFRDPSWVRNFARWGYPDGFYMVVGVLEALGGAALLAPPLSLYGALLLMAIMFGAAVTHLVHGDELLPSFHGEYVIVLRDGARVSSSRGFSDRLRGMVKGTVPRS